MSAQRLLLAALSLSTWAGAAHAQDASPTPPPPYSLPWQLRPVIPASVVRSDTTIAFYSPPGQDSGRTIASMLLASYKVTPELAPLVRLGITNDSPPAGDGKTALQNPVLGALYGIRPSDASRLGLFLGVALPFGSGGGNVDPADTDQLALVATQGRGILARSAMDNAMFSPNHLTVFPGVGFAWVAGGLTAQVEATVLFLNRVKGDEVAGDGLLINSTYGFHLGYFVLPVLSFGAELRYQRLLKKRDDIPSGDARLDNLTVAGGPRVHLELGDSIWFRPGIAYARGLDDPMSESEYNIVQLDLPVAF